MFDAVSVVFHVVFFLPAVTEAGKAGGALSQDFFREEYILNNAIGIQTHPDLLCCHHHLFLASWSHFFLFFFFVQEPAKNPM